MAITGVADADIVTIAKTLGVSRGKVATLLGYTYDAASITFADHGSSHQGDLTLTNMWGLCIIDWGDGVTTKIKGGASVSTTHIYSGAGARTVKVVCLARYKTATATIT